MSLTQRYPAPTFGPFSGLGAAGYGAPAFGGSFTGSFTGGFAQPLGQPMPQFQRSWVPPVAPVSATPLGSTLGSLPLGAPYQTVASTPGAIPTVQRYPAYGAPVVRTAVAPKAKPAPFAIRLGATMPNFACSTTEGDYQFHDLLARNPDCPWTVLMTHPKDYTPVCTTELGRAHQLAGEFAKRGVQLVALSCDDTESHLGWTQDILANIGDDSPALNFPIIADSSREIVSTLGMLDPLEIGAAGLPLPARGLVVIDEKKQVRLYILYPATTGRNFDEVLRGIDSLQITRDLKLASPVDWKYGDRMIVAPPVPTEEAKTKYEDFQIKELPSGKEYLRSVKCPDLKK